MAKTCEICGLVRPDSQVACDCQATATVRGGARKKSYTGLLVCAAIAGTMLWTYHDHAAAKEEHKAPGWAYAEKAEGGALRSKKVMACAADRPSAEAWGQAMANNNAPARYDLQEAGKVKLLDPGTTYRRVDGGAFFSTIETAAGERCIVDSEFVTQVE